ncbi:MAG: hypothetical protein EPN45_04470 [Rhizobiaceae bacterium]|nr:MAG: hypothetical protein EPN45_04470 [Rhizobiaceae bacterium]
MNVHIQPPADDTAAARAYGRQAEMEQYILKAKDLGRIIVQFGTQEDAVPDSRDQLALMTLAGFLDDTLASIEELRQEIREICHESKYGRPTERVAA